jgi:hypothetical protein
MDLDMDQVQAPDADPAVDNPQGDPDQEDAAMVDADADPDHDGNLSNDDEDEEGPAQLQPPPQRAPAQRAAQQRADVRRAALRRLAAKVKSLEKNASQYVYKDANIELHFKSLDELTAYTLSRQSANSNSVAAKESKLRTYGKPPQKYSGTNANYLVDDFLDQCLTHINTDSGTESEVVATIHSLVVNPCRKWLASQFKTAGLVLKEMSLEQYSALIREYSALPVLTPMEQYLACFRLKLGNQPFDDFVTSFHELMARSEDMLNSTPAQLAAFFQSLPTHIQQHVKRSPDGSNWQDLKTLISHSKEAVIKFGKSPAPKDTSHNNLSKVHSGRVEKRRRTKQFQQRHPQKNTLEKLTTSGGNPDYLEEISKQAQKLLKTQHPTDIGGKQPITLKKYLTGNRNTFCCYCLKQGHTIHGCSIGKISSLPKVQSALANSTFFCSEEEAPGCRYHPVRQQASRQQQESTLQQEHLSSAELLGDSVATVHTSLDSCCNHEFGLDFEHSAQLSLDSENVNTSLLTQPVDSTVTVQSTKPALTYDFLKEEDFCLHNSYFHLMQTKAQLTCTIDCFALDNGSNSLCSKYRCPSNTAFNSLYAKDIVFANPPYTVVDKFVKHLVACKALSKDLGAIVLIPNTSTCKAAITLADKHMHHIHTFPIRTGLFHTNTEQGRVPCEPCPWPVLVYAMYPGKAKYPFYSITVRKLAKQLRALHFDQTPHSCRTTALASQPVPPDSDLVHIPESEKQIPCAANLSPPDITDEENLFRYKAEISGYRCFINSSWKQASSVNNPAVTQSFLLDSGATVEALVSKELVDTLKVKVHPFRYNARVHCTMADGSLNTALGYCHLKLNVQGLRTSLRALVVNTSPTSNPDIVVGQLWMRRHKVLLNYGNHTATAFKGTKKFILKSECPPLPTPSTKKPKVVKNPKADPAPQMISAKAVRRAIKKGQHVIHTTVKAAAGGSYNDVTDPKIKAILDKYTDVWPDELPPELPPVRDLPKAIELIPGAKPQFRTRGRYTQAEKAEMWKQIEWQLKAGRLRPSHSPWGAPVLFVPKNTGRGLRMCIDYRALNNVTVKNRYPLPRIDDLLDSLDGAKHFTSLDLLHGYMQVRLHEDEIQPTAFVTPYGLYEWLILPFGLTNAPSVFQTMVNQVLKPLLYKGVMVYIDDVLIYTKTLEEHYQVLEEVFKLFREHKLYICLEKCHFLKTEQKFLGHVVSEHGISVDPDKVKAIADMVQPRDPTEVRSFCGFMNYFRRFIPQLALTLKPLHDLTRKGADWFFSPECVKAFEEAKQKLIKATLLQVPDFTKPFEVITDASNHHVGGCLLQDGRPIAFESRLLNSAEQNYGTPDRELLAVFYCFTKWRAYLDGVPSTVYTDHSPLQFTQTQKNLNPRQVRWLEYLQSFRPHTVYRPGKGNPADILTRLYVVKSHCVQGCEVAKVLANTYHTRTHLLASSTVALSKQVVSPSVGVVATKSIQLAPVLPVIFRDAYAHDPFYSASAELLAKDKVTKDDFGLYWHTTPNHRRLCVPSTLQQSVLYYCHDSPSGGHLGYHKTFQKVTQQYWWPHLRRDVAHYCKTCASCQQYKPSPARKIPLHPLPTADGPFTSVSMDFLTCLPRTSQNYDSVLVLVDRFSKFVLLIPTVATVDAKHVAKLVFNTLVPYFGVPTEFISDRDPKFTSEFFEVWCESLGITQSMSSGFHPKTDGQTERMIRTVQQVMRFYVLPNQSDWDTALPMIAFALNSSYNNSTEATAYEVVLGFTPASPFDRLLGFRPEQRVLDKHSWIQHRLEQLRHAKLALDVARSRMISTPTYDKCPYQVGDSCWLSTKHLKLKTTGSRKLVPRFVGPYKVIKVVNPVAVKLELPSHMKVHPVFHISELRTVPEGTRFHSQPAAVEVEGISEYIIDKILDHRVAQIKNKPGYKFLVKWLGYGPDHNSWLTEDDFTSDGLYENTMLQQYKQDHQLAEPHIHVSNKRPAVQSRASGKSKQRR